MSEARNQRFEIDIDEIEKQLRRSAEPPPAKPDPLAELARIVGQDDPFRQILGRGSAPAAAPASNVHVLSRTQPPRIEPVLGEADRSLLGGEPEHAPRHAEAAHDDLFDPVQDAYGSHDDAYARDDMQPLQPRRSRGRLAAVAAALLVTAGAVAGGLYWKKGTAFGGSSGTPPVVVADRTPLKVAPENPGGVEVPNQNRQIYERGTQDGQSRVVDGREQPIDVREAARSLPSSAPPVSGRQPVGSGSDPMSGPRGDATSASRNAVASALGEPRRVRTVAVKPDGTTYAPGTAASVADTIPSLVPGNLPPPVPVSTVPVSGRSTGVPATAPAPVQAASAAAAPVSVPATVDAGGMPGLAPVRILPPARPKLDVRRTASASEEAPTRTASVQTRPDPKPAASSTSEAAAAAGRKTYSVQIAVRPTEDEARTAYSQLQDKFATDLDGRSAKLTKAEVNGKTVHRVRVGPLPKDEADALCSRLKSSGGACFVAAN